MSNQTDNTDQDEHESAISIFQPISHPVLKSVDPMKVAKFLRDRERYEIEVAEKKKEIPSLTKATYKVSVDPGLLRRMHFLGKFKEVAPGRELSQLTSTHIEKWVKSLVERETTTYDPAIIEKAITGLRVPMHIADPEARMLEYCSQFFERLESVGYDNFKDNNPKKTVSLLISKLYPRKFKETMEQALEYHENLKKDVVTFVELLCEEAKAYEKYKQQDQPRDKHQQRNQERQERSRRVKTKRGNGKYDNRGKGAGSSSDHRTGKRPLCLNEECAKEGKHHYVLTECEKTSKEKALELIKEHKNKSKKKSDGESKKLTDIQGSQDNTENSTLLNAMFANCITRIICADIGSDINLMPPDVLSELIHKEVKVLVRTFDAPRKYGLAATKGQDGRDLHVLCHREVTVNVEIFIRHGCYLELRNPKWYVATSDVLEPLLGRPTLEALGINSKELLEAATDKMGSSIDMEAILTTQNYPEGSVARIIREGVYHSDKGLPSEMYEDEDDSWLDLGKDSVQEVSIAIERAVQQAKDKGLSEPGQYRLRKMLNDNSDVCRLRLGNDPPADVEPMKVEIKQDSRPFAAKPRRYPPAGRKFMEQFADRIIEYGFGKVTTEAKWIAAPVLVEKPPPAYFRLTFDYRPVNAATVPMTWPMPHIDSELSDIAGSKCFAIIDFVCGYWQLPLEEESQDLLSFMVSSKVVKPTRTTMGAKNSGPNFQSKVEPLFNDLRESLKAWMDDFMLHSETEEELLDNVENFLRICAEKRLKISLLKSNFFLKQVRWCGRVIDGEGVQFDPSGISGLQGIYLPRTAAEFCEYVHCLQWMANGIPDFVNRVAPFKELLEEAYRTSGSRTKKSIQRIQLAALNWNKEHEKLFMEFQEQLRNLVKLSHRDPKKALCVYTDASDVYWSGVITQCEPEDLDKELKDQKHEPLAFLGAAFKGSEEYWTTFEKETYAIYQVFKKMDYLFHAEDNTHVHTDHRNLLFVFNPLALDSTLGRHVVNKVQRWGLYLSRFSYVIEHIEGDKNIMADVMTRWWRGYRGKRQTIKKVTHLILERDIVESPTADEFNWPTRETIKRSQQGHEDEAERMNADRQEDLWTVKDKIWIPEEDSELQLKLLVVAHCGPRGHRARDATISTLKECYYWNNMALDCEEFILNCIHCLTGRTGHRIPRPLSMTVHGTRPNEVIHFDFLYMGPGILHFKYILVIRDDLSSYLWLIPSKSADAETTAKALANWIRVFTIMLMWVSDQASHFKNRVMKELANEHRIKHQFTVAYSPWVNGTVESCMKQVQATYRCLQSELKLGPQDWPTVVGMMQTALNEAPLKRLGSREDGTYRTPLEVMTGIKPVRTMVHTSQVADEQIKERKMEKVKAWQVMNIEKLQKVMDEMHKDVNERVKANRAKEIKHHNKKTNLVEPRFAVGDFVLVRRAQDKGHKQSFRWMGPRRVTKMVSELVYEVEALITHKRKTVHAARLLMYKANMDGKKVSMELSHSEHSEAKYEIVDELMDITGNTKDGIDILVKWLGLPDKRDWTWHPIEDLYEDIPDRVKHFLTNTKKNKVANAAKSALGLED